MIFCTGGTDFEAEVLRDRILEAEAEEEEEEERIWEASRITSTVEGPCITRWTGLTLRSNSGASGVLIAHACFLLTHYDPIPQTNHCKANRTLPAAGVEDRP